MAGLLGGGMQPQQPQAPMAPQQPQQPGQAPAQGPQGGNEQQMYTVLVESMLGFLYGPGADATEQVLQTHENPVEAIGMATANLMAGALEQLRGQGKMAPPNVVSQAGMELAEAVGEMAAAMGLLDPEDTLAIEMGYFIGLDQLGDQVPDEPPGIQQHFKQVAKGLLEQRMAMLSEEDVPEDLRSEWSGGGSQQMQRAPQEGEEEFV